VSVSKHVTGLREEVHGWATTRTPKPRGPTDSHVYNMYSKTFVKCICLFTTPTSTVGMTEVLRQAGGEVGETAHEFQARYQTVQVRSICA